ncbi:uncharacterized protein LAESUDRAFT_722803 [Laetiporus sulphureus 93-53]|uniref:Ubiquitin-like domain-containing protein n=1 Tax=Laetiporus sulphureus 93-53 TaxID=1314785 RepID=A0A165FKA6_9APHY|nr:uncharacterized protein LAESUDRAFT_722803 [Laetiporus sulphureus 93-53]KZT09101.1 hypothetical protein LAESUDRAFT_722803 [Laetiporus sulphureus 93-53]
MDIWCLLINHEKEPIGTPSAVPVSSMDTVDHLRNKVKAHFQPALDSIAVNELVV